MKSNRFKLALLLAPEMDRRGYDKQPGQAIFKKMLGPEPDNNDIIEIREGYTVAYNLYSEKLTDAPLNTLNLPKATGAAIVANLGYETQHYDLVTTADKLMPLMLTSIIVKAVEVRASKDFTPERSQKKYGHATYTQRQLFVRFEDKAGNRGAFFTRPVTIVKGKGIGSYTTLGHTSDWFKRCQPVEGIGYEPSIKPGDTLNIQAKVKAQHANGSIILERVRIIGREVDFIPESF